MSKKSIFDVMLVLEVIGGASCGKFVIIPDCLVDCGVTISVNRDDYLIVFYNDFDFDKASDDYIVDFKEEKEFYLRYKGVNV